MAENKILLQVKNICKSFENKEIIKNINLNLHKGELVSLLGVSGSGKSTLFNIIAGILQPDSGEVLLSDADITGLPGKISYMLQKDLLFPYKKVIDNVSLPLVIRGMSRQKAREEANKLFAAFDIDGTQQFYPAKLSGGMRQRAALLRTYLASDGIALLDEPFSALDTITKSKIHRWYIDIMEKIDLSTLFITHDINEAILLSDRIYVLGDSPATIVYEVAISPSRIERNNFELTDMFLQYKRKIITQLNL